MHIAPVKVHSHYRPRWADALGDGALESAAAGARSLECSESAIGSAHEGVIHIATVKIVSQYRPRCADLDGEGTLARACARARSFKSRDFALCSSVERDRLGLCRGLNCDRQRGEQGHRGKQCQSSGFHEISFLSFFLLASAPALVAKADVPTLVSPADTRVQ